MNKRIILPSLVLALAFSIQPLNAAKKAAPPSTAPGDTSSATFLDKKSQAQAKRTRFLAEKNANNDFLNSPQGIVFKNQLKSLDDELNVTYEKYLNLFRADPATEKGKQMRTERDRQLQLLNQKRAKAEADYEALKKSSPVYHAMLQKRLDNPKKKGKAKSKAPKEEGDEK